MPRLKDAKAETFAQAIASNPKLARSQAALEAGYSVATSKSAACRLWKRKDVRDRVEEIRAQVSQIAIRGAGISKAAIMEALWKIAHDKDEPASSRVRSLELLGKQLKMFQDVTTHKFEVPTDLSQATDEQLEMLQYWEESLKYGEEEARQRAEKRMLEAAPVVIDTAPVEEAVTADPLGW